MDALFESLFLRLEHNVYRYPHYTDKISRKRKKGGTMGILEEAKSIGDALHEAKNIELYQKMLDLRGDVLGLVEQNNTLREENKRLNELLRVQKQMKFMPPVYYQEGDQTPFCPNCWEAKRLAMHLKHYKGREYVCLQCGKFFPDGFNLRGF